MDTALVITTVIAAYGAIVSSLAVYLHFRSTKPRLRVTITNMFMLDHLLRGMGDMNVSLAAANVGEKPVTVSTYGLQVPSLRTNEARRGLLSDFLARQPMDRLALPGAHSNDRFPKELAVGQACSVWIDARFLASELKRLGYSGKVPIRAYFGDSADNTFRSSPMNLNVEAFLHPSEDQ